MKRVTLVGVLVALLVALSTSVAPTDVLRGANRNDGVVGTNA